MSSTRSVVDHPRPGASAETVDQVLMARDPLRIKPLPAYCPTEVGGYRIVGAIGTGGTGEVFLAEAIDGRPVAIKLIHRHLCDDDTVRVRLARELELAGEVDSVAAVKVLAADAEAQQPWLATEYVPGPTLDQYVADRGPLGADELRSLGVALLEAVHALHRARIVHRDIKPNNVIVSPAGPRLIDLGIALHLHETRLTNTGGAVGTPSYMAPETISGEAISPAIDVFGWGATMYFAATGMDPFGQGNPAAVMHRVLNEDPDLSAVPATFADVLAGSLAKEVHRRLTLAEVLNQLDGSAVDALPTLAIETMPALHSDPMPLPVAPESVGEIGDTAGQEDVVGLFSRRIPKSAAVLGMAVFVAVLAGLVLSNQDEPSGRLVARSEAGEEPGPTLGDAASDELTVGDKTTTPSGSNGSNRGGASTEANGGDATATDWIVGTVASAGDLGQSETPPGGDDTRAPSVLAKTTVSSRSPLTTISRPADESDSPLLPSSPVILTPTPRPAAAPSLPVTSTPQPSTTDSPTSTPSSTFPVLPELDLDGAISEVATDSATITLAANRCVTIAVTTRPSASVPEPSTACRATHTLALSDLSPGVAYSVSATASDEDRRTATTTVEFTTDDLTVSTSARATSATATSVQLAIEATPACVEVTSVQLSPAGGTATPGDGCRSSHGLSVTGLRPDTAYRATIGVVSQSGTTDSVVVAFSTSAEASVDGLVVSSLTATADGPNKARVSFLSSQCGFGDYRYRSLSGANQTGEFIGSADTSRCYTRHGITLGTDTDPLRAGTDYELTVTVTGEDGRTASGTTRFRTADLEIYDLRVVPVAGSPGLARVTFQSNPNGCAFADYRFTGADGRSTGFFDGTPATTPSNATCYVAHTAVLGEVTAKLAPATDYAIEVELLGAGGSRISKNTTYRSPG